MMQARDWLSGAVGTVIFLMGLFPFLNGFGAGPTWWGFSLPVKLMGWLVMIGGFYLIINSFVEITNSNIVGWVSLSVAALITLFGVLHVLGQMGTISASWAGWIPGMVFNLMFMALGAFLMVATVAMEL